ncbi:uncharacterized protein KQ657_001264 [Scheffersomyces spartinae]|uniref:HTH La-type RNA-binding domain-containing protein n=1 Tax=Scheffersomyces spartinae TaxID=45513 RepID=A0A9P8AI62_9ASCO|nr:uncharacterized protein KQ657_001264 [Scheffersomyces spartinae]KAG7192809.1 hypothetical protein KQ657_001264 [Scheffersomyces spartinae]
MSRKRPDNLKPVVQLDVSDDKSMTSIQLDVSHDLESLTQLDVSVDSLKPVALLDVSDDLRQLPQSDLPVDALTPTQLDISSDYSAVLYDSGYDSDLSSIVMISSSITEIKHNPRARSTRGMEEVNEMTLDDTLSSMSSPFHDPYYPTLVFQIYPQPTHDMNMISSYQYLPMSPLHHHVPLQPYFEAGMKQHNTAAPTRRETIKKQLKYYFSIENLCKDIYLRQQFNHKTGGIKIDTLLNFNKIKCIIGNDKRLLISIIRDQCSEFLELIDDVGDQEVRIYNWQPWVLPKRN